MFLLYSDYIDAIILVCTSMKFHEIPKLPYNLRSVGRVKLPFLTSSGAFVRAAPIVSRPRRCFFFLEAHTTLVDIVDVITPIPLFIGFYISQVVQDFVHEQYDF